MECHDVILLCGVWLVDVWIVSPSFFVLFGISLLFYGKHAFLNVKDKS